MAKEIIIEVTEKGEVSVEANDFQGVGCAAITDAFKNLGKVVEDKTKPEYKDKCVKYVQK